MRSHLTRQVVRRLVANEPVVHRGCLRRQTATSSCAYGYSRCWLSHDGHALVARPQRRSFLNMFAPKKKMTLYEADVDPGLEVLMHLAKMQRMRARLPTVDAVEDAVTQFFQHKRIARKPMTDTEARLALKGLYFCLGQPETPSQSGTQERPSKAILSNAAKALHWSLAEGISSTAHLDLAKVVFELSNAAIIEPSLATEEHEKMRMGRIRAMRTYVLMLADLGQIEQARQLLDRELHSHLEANARHDLKEEVDSPGSLEGQRIEPMSLLPMLHELWHDFLSCRGTLENRTEFMRTLSVMRERGISDGNQLADVMLKFHIRHGDLEGIKEWFPKSWKALSLAPSSSSTSQPERQAYSLGCLLKWCLTSNQIEYGHHVVREVLETAPEKPVWDIVFVWAAGCGKGADEIDRMITVMENAPVATKDGSKRNYPDVRTINALVEYAIWKDDPYLAERFIVLGKDRKIQPDARTFVLQMKYRLKVDDIDGALTAYKSLQTVDQSSNEDVPVVNELIVALCDRKRHDFETIMAVVADLSDRRARFDAFTVARLSVLHLDRDENDDVIDLLKTHANQYSSTERSSIVESILSYVLSPTTHVPRAWDGYLVLRTYFDEISRLERTKMMLSFFSRKRPDMAVNVFTGMRSHSRRDTIPTVETYNAALLAAAENQDLENVNIIHNQLKLDFNIDVNTYLRNTLMIAYIACNESSRALNFWADIAASKEGPTFNSIHIAMRACESSPFGDVTARKIWGKLLKMNVELDQSLWASYAGALAGNGNIHDAFSILEKAAEKGEVEIDAFLLASLYCGALGTHGKEAVEDWARDRHAAVWKEVEALGFELDSEGDKHIINFDRAIGP